MRTGLLITIAALLLVPATAAASGADVIADCVAGDGRLSRTFTQAEYKAALRDLPADADQYSPCRDAIRAAARGAGISGPGSSPGSAPTAGSSWGGAPIPGVPPGVDPLQTATPEETTKIAAASKTGDAALNLDGRPVDPDTLGSSLIGSPFDLPAPLLAVLAAALAGFILTAIRTTAINVGSRRSTD